MCKLKFDVIKWHLAMQECVNLLCVYVTVNMLFYLTVASFSVVDYTENLEQCLNNFFQNTLSLRTY
jgi:hypothetical protein